MKDTNLIIGKKNTGKTTYILFNELKESIKRGENLCIYNTRDEYFKTFSKTLKENNYNVITLNIDEAKKSNGFNPLQVPYELYKEGQKDKSIELIDSLAKEIFKEDNPYSDPFWQNMASNYFTGLVLILFNEGKTEEINLGSIQVMMNQGEEKYKETTILKNYLENIDATNTIYTMLSPIVFAPSDTKGSIISVCKQKLNNYMYKEELLNMLNTNDINVRNIKQKTAIIIIASKQTDIANIFINQLVETSNMSFTYILDNFDALRKLLCLNNLLDNATYNNNKILIAIHNENEFKDIYGKYSIDKFENVINLNENNEIINNIDKIELGNDSDYPTLNIEKHKYFNLKNI